MEILTVNAEYNEDRRLIASRGQLVSERRDLVEIQALRCSFVSYHASLQGSFEIALSAREDAWTLR